MNRKGFSLIEVLIAATLLSLAGAGIYSGISHAVRMRRAIYEMSVFHDPIQIFWEQTGKDLRNAVALRDYRFIGKSDEMIFPVLRSSTDLFRVRYFVKEGALFRSEEKLPEKFVRETPLEECQLKGLTKCRFEYGYLDEEEKLVFRPDWSDDPYFGIPEVVKVEVTLKGSSKIFSQILSLQQGRWGHLTEEEKTHA